MFMRQSEFRIFYKKLLEFKSDFHIDFSRLARGLTGTYVGLLARGLTGTYVGLPARGLTGTSVGLLARGLTGTYVGLVLGGGAPEELHILA
jgi:hypothetical protein